MSIAADSWTPPPDVFAEADQLRIVDQILADAAPGSLD